MKLLRLFVAVITVFLALNATSTSASAQGINDFVIKNFEAKYTLTNKDPQGFLEVTEIIEVDFSGLNQGILRAIPSTYNGNDLHMKIQAVTRSNSDSDGTINSGPEPYIIYEENGNEVIKIGTAGIFHTGRQTYTLNYQLENVISFYDQYDEFYWDVNGDQSIVPVESVKVSLETSARNYAALEPECFTGSFGSIEKNCDIFRQSTGLDANTTIELEPNSTLTIVQAYDKGYFTPLSWTERYQYVLIALPVIALHLFVLRFAHKRWVKYGKDYKKRGVMAPYFERPKGVSVMQASYVSENRLSAKHLSASIVDLAIRGYIQITERKAGKKTLHDLTLMKPFKDDNDIREDERLLLVGIFKTEIVGGKVELESKQNKLYKTLQKLRTVVDEQTKAKGFYELSPKSAGSKTVAMLVAAILGLVLGVIFADITNYMTLISGAAVLVGVVAYSALMAKRSKQGNLLVEHVNGLTLYLSKAEKDRMSLQDAVAAPLSANSDQPTRTVAFFEKLLPYAVAAGVEKTWAEAFSNIYSQPPEWYSGNWSSFSTAALASSLAQTTNVTTQSFTAPSSSSSSGSGGGGFSGGGGGGGGVGGW